MNTVLAGGTRGIGKKEEEAGGWQSHGGVWKSVFLAFSHLWSQLALLAYLERVPLLLFLRGWLPSPLLGAS